MAKRGDLNIGKDPDPVEPTKVEPEPVTVAQTVEVSKLEAYFKEKLEAFEGTLQSKLLGGGEVTEKLTEILEWMKTEKPATMAEVKVKVADTVPKSLLSRIPHSMTFLNKPLWKLFNGEKDGEKEE